MNNYIDLAGRILLGLIFVMAGFSKLGDAYAGTAGYMDSMGIPGGLLPLVIATELLGGILIITGFKTKWAAFALAGFTLLAGIIFHSNFADQMQSILFMKNLAIAGGLALLFIHGAGKLSLDQLMNKSDRIGASFSH